MIRLIAYREDGAVVWVDNQYLCEAIWLSEWLSEFCFNSKVYLVYADTGINVAS